MRYAYQAYEVVIAFVGRIRRLRRILHETISKMKSLIQTFY